MAELTLTIPRDPDWADDDKIVASIGASGDIVGLGEGPLGSGPLGGPELNGTDVLTALVGDVAEGGLSLGRGPIGDGNLGQDSWERVVLNLTHRPDTPDKCGVIVMSVRVEDLFGNDSGVVIANVGLSDPPIGARGLTIATTGSPNEVRLSWTASADV